MPYEQGKNKLKKDNETRALLLESARKEFMEKGYANASLRNICKNANMTTGALYYFFQDKQDLFEAIAGDVIESLYQILKTHFEEELAEDELSAAGDVVRSFQDDYEVASRAIHQMYAHRDEMLMILTGSQGSTYENVEEQFVEMAEAHYRLLADKMGMVYPEVVLDDKMIHWLSHMQMDAFVYMIIHIEKEEEALVFMKRAIAFMISGWYGIYQN